jgi:hypothetical protein
MTVDVRLDVCRNGIREESPVLRWISGEVLIVNLAQHPRIQVGCAVLSAE